MKIVKTKIFKVLVCICLAFFIIGIISFIILDSDIKINSVSNIKNYINNVKMNNIKYITSIFSNISSNLFSLSLIWIFGLLCITIFIAPVFLIYNSVLIGYNIALIFYVYKFKGIIISLLYLFPFKIINLLIIILITYYAVHQSNKTYKIIKANDLINIKNFFKKYVLIYMILSFISIFISILEIYYISFIINIVV